jgi:hypothetical protein
MDCSLLAFDLPLVSLARSGLHYPALKKRKLMSPDGYKVFISHGSHDLWVAGQIARAVRETGAAVFLDQSDIPKGADLKKRIHEELEVNDELIALFTPWSAKRSWVWVEIGAAWSQQKPVVAVFYGMTASDLDESGQGKAILEDLNMIDLNEFQTYIEQLLARVRSATR